MAFSMTMDIGRIRRYRKLIQDRQLCELTREEFTREYKMELATLKAMLSTMSIPHVHAREINRVVNNEWIHYTEMEDMYRKIYYIITDPHEGYVPYDELIDCVAGRETEGKEREIPSRGWIVLRYYKADCSHTIIEHMFFKVIIEEHIEYCTIKISQSHGTDMEDYIIPQKLWRIEEINVPLR